MIKTRDRIRRLGNEQSVWIYEASVNDLSECRTSSVISILHLRPPSIFLGKHTNTPCRIRNNTFTSSAQAIWCVKPSRDSIEVETQKAASLHSRSLNYNKPWHSLTNSLYYCFWFTLQGVSGISSEKTSGNISTALRALVADVRLRTTNPVHISNIHLPVGFYKNINSLIISRKR